MFLDERRETKDERLDCCHPGGHRPVGSIILLFAVLIFSSCYDIGDRDNPLDPGAANYVAYEESSSSRHSGLEPESSSSRKVSSSSSKKVASSSSKKASSSSSKNVVPSSSSVPKSATSVASNGSSDSQKASSSSVTPVSSGTVESSTSSKTSSSSRVDSIGSSSLQNDSKSSSSKNIAQSSSTKVESSSSKNVAQSSGDVTQSATSVASNGSSDSQKVSSSSTPIEVLSSSSEDSWTCGTNPLVRDDVEYKTVVIKEKCFTKENLRYVPKAGGNTMCYGGKSENCETYGLLYDFEAASLACPTGWRLPTSAEYIELQDYSGDDMYDAGTHFKATSGWTNENGDDFLEFTALPGGYCDEDGCIGLGSMGYWWTSTEKVKNASHLTLFLNGDGGAFTAEKKMDNDKFASVRCVKIQK